jgi:hypothetical protein
MCCNSSDEGEFKACAKEGRGFGDGGSVSGDSDARTN